MKKNNLIFLILIFIFSLVGISSLFHPGFFLTDDGNSMVIRFSAFYETLKSGQFPVRFLSRLNYGFGYPVADFLYPLFMYIGVPIHILKFNFVDTIKIILGMSMIGSGIFTYFWLSKLFDRFSSFIGAVFYFYTPYHLYDAYVRGSVGEVLALAIAPFILWQLERKSLLWSAIGIGLLILAHNTLAILFLLFVVLYMALDIFIAKNKKNVFNRQIKVLLFGLGLSSFFSIPAVFDLQYTVFSKTQVSNWGNYFSGVNLIGISAIATMLFTLIFIFTKKIEVKKHRLTILVLVIGIISIFFATPPSTFLWNLLPVSFIQFPFRFLSIAILCSSFLACCITSVLKGQLKIIMGLLLLLLALFSSSQFIFPKVFQDLPDTFYSTNQDSTTVRNEYMPKWIKIQPTQMPTALVEPSSSINFLSGNSNNMSFKVSGNKSITVEVQKVFFPGWKASVDNKEVKIQNVNPKGLIQIPVTAGDHIIHVYFQEDGIRLLSDLISLSSMILLVVYSLNKKKNITI